MTIPKYLETFRRAVREQEERAARERKEYEINEFNEKSPHLISSNSFNSYRQPQQFPFADAFDSLERRRPEYIETDRWQQCLIDARRFLASWGDKAAALGWTADELFGLHDPPARPHPSYSRLSRYRETGLLWLLRGRRVIALTADTAAIDCGNGSIVTYRKLNKPAFGPLGDSLDDFTR